MELSSGFAGLSTALPLLSFGLFSFLVPRLSHRFGNELTL